MRPHDIAAGAGGPSRPPAASGVRSRARCAAIASVMVLAVTPGAAPASDFTPLMVLLLVPFSVLALLVWALTWLPTRGLEPAWLKIVIRTFGVCLVFTPTHTAGGNGRMLSVSLYDLVASAAGADPVYAKQALVNVLVATAAVSALALLIHYLDRWKPRDRGDTT